MTDAYSPYEDDEENQTPLDNLLAELRSWIILTSVEDDSHTSRWSRAGARDNVVKALAVYDYFDEADPAEKPADPREEDRLAIFRHFMPLVREAQGLRPVDSEDAMTAVERMGVIADELVTRFEERDYIVRKENG